MRYLLFSIILALVVSDIYGCSCAGPQTPAGAFSHADAVFAGVVETIEDPGGDRIRALPEHERIAAQRATFDSSWGPERGRKLTFRVMQWWKGESLGESVEIWTGYGGGDCGYPVEEGKSYLVYSRRTLANRLIVGICDGSAALVCSTDQIGALGPPIKTFEAFDTEKLITREQPYTAYWRNCIEPARLIGERDLRMDRHCRFAVDAVVDREGALRRFVIKPTFSSRAFRCGQKEADHATERAREWRFTPATLDGTPVEMEFRHVSMREPVTVQEYAEFLKRAEEERKKRLEKELPE